MAHGTTQTAATGSMWAGGAAPYGIGSRKLGMWLFIFADSLTFAACLVGYSYVRLAAESWPQPFHLWPSIANAIVMTLFLLSSSLTMVIAVAAAHQEDRRKAVRYILLTMVGGIAFVILHAWEWGSLIFHEGVTLQSNPWGVPLFGATFFALTGLHMTHVTIGVIYLAVVAWRFGRRTLTPLDVEVSGLYWHFVDLVWMFIFPMVYILSFNTAG